MTYTLGPFLFIITIIFIVILICSGATFHGDFNIFLLLLILLFAFLSLFIIRFNWIFN